MGSVLSSDTIYAVAYLTDLGRKYLFDPVTNNRFVTDANNVTTDAFKISYFSMSDPDYNYNMTSGKLFETGDIADISGKNDDCIKGTIVNKENNLISVNGEVGGVPQAPGTTTTTGTIPDLTETYFLSTDMASINNKSQVSLEEMISA